MPFAGEKSSALGQEEILKDPEVAAFLEQCSYLQDPEPFKEELFAHVLDLTGQLQEPSEGIILAADGSSYESAIENMFPSVRVGLVKLGQVFLSVQEYRALNNSESAFIDPIVAAKVAREKGTFAIPVTGAGVRIGERSYSASFRKSVFDAFVSERFQAYGAPLLDTLIDLCRRMGRTATNEHGVETVFLKANTKCPVTGEALSKDLHIPVNPGWCAHPTASEEQIYVTDLLRLSEAFADEGANAMCLTRIMNICEHLLLAHTLRQISANAATKSAMLNLTVIMDGPLAVFGEPAVFHRGVMHLIDEIRNDFDSDAVAPLIVGVTKSGPVVDHGKLIQPILREKYGDGRVLVIPITDEYRYRYIDRGTKNPDSNYGERTHYGQNFLIRTRSGKIFDLSIAYPFADKSNNFKVRKVEFDRYSTLLSRAISMIEMLETDLFVDANIAQHLAHKCASIAHRPSGRTLDAFIKSLVEKAK